MVSAEVALGEHERVFERQATARKEIDQQAVVFDWYIRMLSDLRLTEILLAKGKLTAPTAQAMQFVDAPAAIARAADAPLSAQSGSLPFRVPPASPHRLI